MAMDNSERDRAIVEARDSGMTLKSVGAQFGLSPERVRAIIVRHQRREAVAARNRMTEAEWRERAHHLILEAGFDSLDDLAGWTGKDIEFVFQSHREGDQKAVAQIIGLLREAGLFDFSSAPFAREIFRSIRAGRPGAPEIGKPVLLRTARGWVRGKFLGANAWGEHRWQRMNDPEILLNHEVEKWHEMPPFERQEPPAICPCCGQRIKTPAQSPSTRSDS